MSVQHRLGLPAACTRLAVVTALVILLIASCFSGNAFAQASGVIEADTWVEDRNPLDNFGTKQTLQVDASPRREVFLRMRVTGIGTRQLASALLHLRVSDLQSAGSSSGGALYSISDCTWDELSLTWDTRPAVDGPLLDSAGPVGLDQPVTFDVTSAITGDGVYCFALVTSVGDAVKYRSRDAALGNPVGEIVLQEEPATTTTSTSTTAPTTTTTSTTTAPPTTTTTSTTTTTTAPPTTTTTAPPTTTTAPPTTTTTSTTTTTTAPPTTTTTAPPTTTTTAPPTTTSSTTTTSTSTSSTTLPPVCGDGVVSQPVEECDGTNDALCPGVCGGDCMCPTVLTAAFIADVTAREVDPNLNFGTSTELGVDASSAKESFLRVQLAGLGPRHVDSAIVRMQVASGRNDASDSAGRIHLMGNCAWDELAITWPTRPAIDGPVLDERGAVQSDDIVDFDVTSAIAGDGTYCFALDSLSSDGVTYNSREAQAGGPELIVTVEPTIFAVCGDGVTNQATEQCDGPDDTACPGTCQADCTCPGSVSTTSSSSTTSTSSSSTTSTSLPQPFCGDNAVNQPAEECDGLDDAACPATCQLDCTCGSVLTVPVAADVTARETEPQVNFGSDTDLGVDARTGKETFLRFNVSGIGVQGVREARLHLQVADQRNAASESGGQVHLISNCTWEEMAMTWATRPIIDGAVLDELGPVSSGQAVTFDVTPAIVGDGTYCLALSNASSDGVTYRSREAGTNPPELWVTVQKSATSSTTSSTSTSTTTSLSDSTTTSSTTIPGGPVCGDGIRNQPSEECDGADDFACPVSCRKDCTCADAPWCGDGIINRIVEECDGTDDAACPGVCELDCTCPAPPVCGDGDINQANEECDGIEAPTCPGACLADCRCAPPLCGDNHVNQPTEDCDGADDTACRGRCLADCTCDPTFPAAAVIADVSVHENEPNTNFGTSTDLWADANSIKRTFLRIRVRGVGTDPILHVRLRLRASDDGNAGSKSGGRLHTMTDCSWDELAMIFTSQPVIDGPVLDEVGAVASGDTVEFDLTPAIAGDGTYCFALDSTSSDGVKYYSREVREGRPLLDIVTAGVCGDGRVNQPGEACDGDDDDACPASCLSDCTCAVCGDGITDAPVETCDGLDNVTCPGECGITCSCPGDSPPPFSCLAQGPADLTLAGTWLAPYANLNLTDGTTIDARRAAFVAFPDNDDAIDLDGGSTGICWAGGTVLGQYDRSLGWDTMHDFHNAGIAFDNFDSTIDGIRIDNMTDGIRPRSEGAFTIRHAWLSYIRDDCVENDHLQGGLVDDTLFDGCYVGFSARPGPLSLLDGSANVWTIQNTLVRLEPMPGPRGGNATEFGHGGFFKWHSWDSAALSVSPKLALYNNIFMAEMIGEVGGERMGVPPDQVIDCANNTMVWLGPGDFPGILPPCFTVTTDRTVWDDAVVDWLARHPGVGW